MVLPNMTSIARLWQEIKFADLAFNLNLGSLVGGVALRYRLYSRRGLDNVIIGSA